MTFYCLKFKTPQPGGPSLCIYILPEKGGQVIPSDTGFHFVASYDSQGFDKGIPPHLHTDWSWTWSLWLLIRLVSSLYNISMDSSQNTTSENSSSIVHNLFVAAKTCLLMPYLEVDDFFWLFGVMSQYIKLYHVDYHQHIAPMNVIQTSDIAPFWSIFQIATGTYKSIQIYWLQERYTSLYEPD